jgi:hypothetical protein
LFIFLLRRPFASAKAPTLFTCFLHYLSWAGPSPHASPKIDCQTHNLLKRKDQNSPRFCRGSKSCVSSGTTKAVMIVSNIALSLDISSLPCHIMNIAIQRSNMSANVFETPANCSDLLLFTAALSQLVYQTIGTGTMENDVSGRVIVSPVKQ